MKLNIFIKIDGSNHHEICGLCRKTCLEYFGKTNANYSWNSKFNEIVKGFNKKKSNYKVKLKTLKYVNGIYTKVLFKIILLNKLEWLSCPRTKGAIV